MFSTRFYSCPVSHLAALYISNLVPFLLPPILGVRFLVGYLVPMEDHTYLTLGATAYPSVHTFLLDLTLSKPTVVMCHGTDTFSSLIIV